MLPQPPRLVTPPAASLLTLDEARRHCRVDHAEDDAFLGAAIAAAQGWLDGWSGILGRCLVSQQWRQDWPGFPAGPLLPLPFPDVTAAAITYVDPAGAEQTLSTAAYHVVSTASAAVLELADGAAWPATAARPDAVRVLLTAGYDTAAAKVPAPIRSAALFMVGDIYRNRETGVVGTVSASIKMSTTVEILLAPYRRVGI
jgi:uncharacterized phiE125 gp8 family phage protein